MTHALNGAWRMMYKLPNSLSTELHTILRRIQAEKATTGPGAVDAMTPDIAEQYCNDSTVPDIFKAAVALMLHVGCRAINAMPTEPSPASAIRWNDIEEKDQHTWAVTLRHTKAGAPTATEVQTIRRTGLSADMITRLTQAKREAERDGRTAESVLPEKGRGTSTTLRNALTRNLRTWGNQRGKRLTPHSLRHGKASAVAAILGKDMAKAGGGWRAGNTSYEGYVQQHQLYGGLCSLALEAYARAINRRSVPTRIDADILLKTWARRWGVSPPHVTHGRTAVDRRGAAAAETTAAPAPWTATTTAPSGHPPRTRRARDGEHLADTGRETSRGGPGETAEQEPPQGAPMPEHTAQRARSRQWMRALARTLASTHGLSPTWGRARLLFADASHYPIDEDGTVKVEWFTYRSAAPVAVTLSEASALRQWKCRRGDTNSAWKAIEAYQETTVML
jgi:integrase